MPLKIVEVLPSSLVGVGFDSLCGQAMMEGVRAFSGTPRALRQVAVRVLLLGVLFALSLLADDALLLSIAVVAATVALVAVAVGAAAGGDQWRGQGTPPAPGQEVSLGGTPPAHLVSIHEGDEEEKDSESESERDDVPLESVLSHRLSDASSGFSDDSISAFSLESHADSSSDSEEEQGATTTPIYVRG
jgi:hypothetical protein